jgi:hypothetical protein
VVYSPVKGETTVEDLKELLAAALGRHPVELLAQGVQHARVFGKVTEVRSAASKTGITLKVRPVPGDDRTITIQPLPEVKNG